MVMPPNIIILQTYVRVNEKVDFLRKSRFFGRFDEDKRLIIRKNEVRIIIVGVQTSGYFFAVELVPRVYPKLKHVRTRIKTTASFVSTRLMRVLTFY